MPSTVDSGDSASAAHTRDQATRWLGRRKWTRDKTVGLLVFLPCVLFMAAIGLYPVLRVLSFSLYKVDIFLQSQEFVGLHNFLTVLTWKDFQSALWNDVVFTGGSISIQTLLGIAVALLLNREFFGRSATRSVILFSYLVPVVVAALVWRFMLNDIVGIVNYIIHDLGLPIPTTWFASPRTAMPSVIMVNVWKFFPFMVIVFLAQLQSIDPVLYEAARVDGANVWQEFWHITLPWLRPVIMIVLMLRTIWTFNHFALIHLLTGGGPMGTTQTPPLLIYDTLFGQRSLGRGATIAVIMFAILAVMSLIYFRLYNWAQEELTGQASP